MRTDNSIKNAMWSVLAFCVNLIVNFVSRKIFISILGVEYNGLNSLFTSIISVLSIAELGIGTTIVFFLYKPLHQKDYELVKSLMAFYKKCYRIIAGVVLLAGMLVMPFLPLIVGEIEVETNIYLVYSLFLAEAVFSYLLSYKRSIIIADQKERVLRYVHIGTAILMNVIQMVLLYFTKNYYLFLIIKIAFICGENYLLLFIANKVYPFIKEKSSPLPATIRSSLNRRIRAMFYHQIGGFVVNGTDNVMISMLFGVAEVGFYNNYFLIVSSVFGLIGGIFSSITASIGNLLISKNESESLKTYRGILAINYLFAAYISCTFYVCAQPLVTLWLGGSYLMPSIVVGSLAVYLYFRIMKLTTVAFKNAAGIFYEDRFIPIIESTVNIIASLLCARFFGVAGIIMGTIISNFVLYFGSYPFIIYRKVFKTSADYYFKQHISYLVLSIIVAALIVMLSNMFVLHSQVAELIKNMIISTVVFAVIFVLLLKTNSSLDSIMRKIFKKFFRNK